MDRTCGTTAPCTTYVDSGRLREDDLRPATRAVVRLTDAIAIGFAGRRSVPAEVAADPTTWPRLWRNAVLGKLYPAERVRERHPEFARWLDLCGAYPALRAGRWPDALAIAERVAAGAGDPRLRAEAHNLAGYALWQLGRIDDALGELGGAGLAVNAVIVATSARGTAAALPHLAEVIRRAADDGLRRTAVRKAADFGERTGQIPPETVRAALALDLRGEVHQRLLALAARHDRAWLASAPLRARRRDNRYYQARAGYQQEPSTVGLTEVAAALGAFGTGPNRPAWVAAENRWLMAVLAGPPEAVDPLPAVEELNQAGVLALADRIRLRAFAGTRQILTTEWSPRARTALPGDDALIRAVEAYRQRAGRAGTRCPGHARGPAHRSGTGGDRDRVQRGDRLLERPARPAADAGTLGRPDLGGEPAEHGRPAAAGQGPAGAPGAVRAVGVAGRRFPGAG